MSSPPINVNTSGIKTLQQRYAEWWMTIKAMDAGPVQTRETYKAFACGFIECFEMMRDEIGGKMPEKECIKRLKMFEAEIEGIRKDITTRV